MAEVVKQIIPSVSIHLGINAGKAQVLVEADVVALLEQLAQNQGNPIVKGVVQFLEGVVKQA